MIYTRVAKIKSNREFIAQRFCNNQLNLPAGATKINTDKENKDLIERSFNKIISLQVKEVGLRKEGFDIGFGNDITIKGNTNGEDWTHIRPEWQLWAYNCNWEITIYNKFVIACSDDNEEMKEALKIIEGRKFCSFSVLNKFHDIDLNFEGEITLRLRSKLYDENLEEEYDNEQWIFFMPDGITLIAGPLESLWIEEY